MSSVRDRTRTLVQNIYADFIAGQLNIFRLHGKVINILVQMEDMNDVIATLPRELFFFEDEFLIIFDWAVASMHPLKTGDIRRQVRALRVHPEKHLCGG